MDLEAALTEAKLAVNLFFNNKFTEAEALMKPWYVCHCRLVYGSDGWLIVFLPFPFPVPTGPPQACTTRWATACSPTWKPC